MGVGLKSIKCVEMKCHKILGDKHILCKAQGVASLRFPHPFLSLMEFNELFRAALKSMVHCKVTGQSPICIEVYIPYCCK